MIDGVVCARRGTSEMPSSAETRPIVACQSPARCAIRGEKPAARQPAWKTSSHDQPTGGATHSSRAAAIEDSQNGIRAAKAAGMRVIAIPNEHFPPDEEALAQADVVLNSLAELTAEAVQPR